MVNAPIMEKAFNAIVHGIVQGVSFRYYTRREAGPLGIKGFVRNLPNGTVEVHAEGDEDALKQLAAWLEHGPSWARVERVELNWCDPEGGYKNFLISF